jgi:hypothetical protein
MTSLLDQVTEEERLRQSGECPHDVSLLDEEQTKRYHDGRVIYCPRCGEQMRYKSLKQKIMEAMEDGTYWVDWKHHKIPLSKINKTYASNIRFQMRRRMKPEEYEGKPLYVALGRIRRQG